ncbi:MAG: hypothetical protein JWQ19_1105 [Subtercola sp.]|nr:hypothetical protein [Subtercola sp.]
MSDALARGVSEKRLRGRDLATPFRGVRTTPTDVADVEAQCASYRPRMPDSQFFSHITAARLWQVPLPVRFSPREPVHVSSKHRARVVCPGVVCHQPRDPAIRVRVLAGFRVTDAATTWCQLASILSLDDLVIAGDSFILVPRYPDKRAHTPRPYTTPELLRQRVSKYHGPGKRKLVGALELVRIGAESAAETRLRLLMIRSGLPEPELNVDISDARGVFIARGDLYYPRWKVLVEYDGDQHRTDTETYESDMTRADDLRASGVTMIRVRKAGLGPKRARTLLSIRRALSLAGWHAP